MTTTTTHINHDQLVTLTQIMAVNGDVPGPDSGWGSWQVGYAGKTQRHNGVLGEVSRQEDGTYVCVRACTALCLPNDHPDYVAYAPTAWVRVPDSCDDVCWDYVVRRYRETDGWRVNR